MTNSDYQIISLGSNCLPRRLLTTYGIKPSKEEGELTCPFDLCVTPIKAVIEILKNNFSDFFDDIEFNTEKGFWVNKKYKIDFNHDKDSKKDFVERFQKRIQNFKMLINNNKYTYFVYFNEKKVSESKINKLNSIIKMLKNDTTYQLIIIDIWNSKLESHDNIEIVSVLNPYDNFHEDWWTRRDRETQKGKAFEHCIIEKIKNIINRTRKIKLYPLKNFGNSRKEIYINFTDFPSPYSQKENDFINILSKYYNVVLSNRPDFLFYSVFGNKHEKYNNCVKIFYTGEVITPNFNECDYAIGFDYINFENRYLRYPIYFQELKESILDRSNITSDFAKRKFCNFIYSNDSCGEGAKLRKSFCQKLSEYKKVDCPGKVLNNMQNAISPREGDFGKGKLVFQKDYKFTIAFENNLYEGYTTEKLSQAFLANTIPIYWGNPEVTRDFNPKAFINCHDYNSLDEVIQKVIELDNDDEAYLKMLQEPCVNSDYKFDKQEQFEKFLISIIEKGNKPFNKNPNPAINKYGYVGATFEEKIKGNKRLIKALDRERARYRLLKNLTFGKKRLRYNEKYHETKELLHKLSQ